MGITISMYSSGLHWVAKKSFTGSSQMSVLSTGSQTAEHPIDLNKKGKNLY